MTCAAGRRTGLQLMQYNSHGLQVTQITQSFAVSFFQGHHHLYAKAHLISVSIHSRGHQTRVFVLNSEGQDS